MRFDEPTKTFGRGTRFGRLLLISILVLFPASLVLPDLLGGGGLSSGSLAVLAVFALLGIWLVLMTDEVTVDRGLGEVRLTKRLLSLTLGEERVPLAGTAGVVLAREERTKPKGGKYEVWTALLVSAGGAPRRVLESQDETQARLCAEALSMASDRPLEDRCTSPPTVRQPRELDVSAADRLRRVPLERVHQLPPGHPVSEERTEGGILLTWSARNLGVAAFTLALAALWLADALTGARGAAVRGALAGRGFDAVGLALFAPFLAIGLGAVAVALYLVLGRQELRVGAQDISFTARLAVPLYTERLPSRSVEEVRVAERLGGPAVELVSDEGIIALRAVGDRGQVEALANRLRTVLAHEL